MSKQMNCGTQASECSRRRCRSFWIHGLRANLNDHTPCAKIGMSRRDGYGTGAARLRSDPDRADAAAVGQGERIAADQIRRAVEVKTHFPRAGEAVGAESVDDFENEAGGVGAVGD